MQFLSPIMGGRPSLNRGVSSDPSFCDESMVISGSHAHPTTLSGMDDDLAATHYEHWDLEQPDLIGFEDSPPSSQDSPSSSNDSAASSQTSPPGSPGSPLTSEGSPSGSQYEGDDTGKKQPEKLASYGRELQYWVKQLNEGRRLYDKVRPETVTAAQVTIDDSVHQELQEFCMAHQVPPFPVLLAAFRATYYKMTGVEDTTIGIPKTDNHQAELGGPNLLLGRTQCMRIKIQEDGTFGSLVEQVRSTAKEGFANPNISLNHIPSKLHPLMDDGSSGPLARTGFALHSRSNHYGFGPTLWQPTPTKLSPTSEFDLELELYIDETSIYGTLAYSTHLFEPETIDSMLSTMRQILKDGLSAPHTKIAALLLANDTTALDNTLTATSEPVDSREQSVIDAFQEQVASFPEAVAIKDHSTKVTYTQLDQWSDEIACRLRGHGLAAETLVGVLAKRSCTTIAAFIGILKADLAYLPLDVSAPAERRETILSSISGRKLVLLGADVPIPPAHNDEVDYVPIVDLCEEQGQATQRSSSTGTGAPSATSLAYVMFTSGSTGKPKGVMIEHRGIVRLAKDTNMISRQDAAKAVAHLSNIAFDASTLEIYTVSTPTSRIPGI